MRATTEEFPQRRNSKIIGDLGVCFRMLDGRIKIEGRAPVSEAQLEALLTELGRLHLLKQLLCV